MNPHTAIIEDALVDVRKAYRLLHDYQRAALDAANYIGSQLALNYQGGYSYFSNCAPRDGKGRLSNWAWDWLNMMFYEFHFNREMGEDKWLNLSIWLFSDTGFFISEHPTPDQTDITTFAPPDKSGTKVGFLVYWQWKQEYYLLKDEPQHLRRFIENDGELPSLLRNDGVIGKCCDFCRVSDETSANLVIDDLIRLARSGAFPLERTIKPV